MFTEDDGSLSVTANESLALCPRMCLETILPPLLPGTAGLTGITVVQSGNWGSACFKCIVIVRLECYIKVKKWLFPQTELERRISSENVSSRKFMCNTTHGHRATARQYPLITKMCWCHGNGAACFAAVTCMWIRSQKGFTGCSRATRAVASVKSSQRQF